MYACIQVPSFDSRVAMSMIEQELGRPWQQVYAELTPRPIAAASLGQASALHPPAPTFPTTAAGRHRLNSMMQFNYNDSPLGQQGAKKPVQSKQSSLKYTITD